MNVFEIASLIAAALIWVTLIAFCFLALEGTHYIRKNRRSPEPKLPSKPPMVSILVPAHNEAIVLDQTITSLLGLDYPRDRYEIIVIDDDSSDNSAQVLDRIEQANPNRNLSVVTTDASNGGKGKSNALNIGLAHATGSLIAVYDADNTPEKDALRLLVGEIVADSKLAAVVGKYRTRNGDATLLSRFVNFEGLSAQRMTQAGRWQSSRVSTITGTNFIIRRSVLESMGGWDVNALAEDTELSFRIYSAGLQIKYQPKSVTWEQEPQTLPVWRKQRTRWAEGSLYAMFKNIATPFKRGPIKARFFILSYLVTYIITLLATVAIIVMVIGYIRGSISNPLPLVVCLAGLPAFVLYTFLLVASETGEASMKNLGRIALMCVVYPCLWCVAIVRGIAAGLKEKAQHTQPVWDKTPRYRQEQQEFLK